MNRRSFLRWLGVAPLVAAVAPHVLTFSVPVSIHDFQELKERGLLCDLWEYGNTYRRSPFDLVYSEGPRVFLRYSKDGTGRLEEYTKDWKGFHVRDEVYVQKTARRYYEKYPQRRNGLVSIDELKAFDEKR